MLVIRLKLDSNSFFYCSTDKTNCPKRSYLLYDNRNDAVHFFPNFAEHDHQQNVRGLNETQINITIRLYGLVVTKTSQILRAFEDKHVVDIPMRTKVVNFLAYYREKPYGTV